MSSVQRKMTLKTYFWPIFDEVTWPKPKIDLLFSSCLPINLNFYPDKN